ncbi:YibE/F family protein [Micromonospora sp. WMMD1102]|uniref:YibE/F family protein n=1 Tax=Micromonospora sp. WMMD1102 TaxID=3016105 RepID=UPI00241557A4|nr:YibE/F family protein [Micromonospora sp. WMMD1102]MDG4789123.1 YibE/F family protein [Micromonospora sp. WMMD1102]
MSSEHAHSHLPRPAPASRAARRLSLALLIPAALLTLVSMVLLWPRDAPTPTTEGDGPIRVLGTVVAVESVPCPAPPAGEERPAGAPTDCGTVTVDLTEGVGAGQRVSTDVPSGPGAVRVAPGDDVALLYLQESPERQYSIIDHQRSTQLWLLGAVFALAVLAFGRWRGLSALAGLGVTFAVLLMFIVPAILDGRSPLLVAIVGAAAIMLTVLYLTHGFSMTTTVAVAGTLVSLTITAALSAVATAAAHLSGIADETSNYLSITQGEVNMRGLLLAGIVIGSLGVLDDVTVTQSATVSELALANPGYGFRRLYSAATRIGRAHIASVINTIVLAYAGASLPLMLLFAADTATPVGELLTSQLIAQELVRSAVGTIGLIAAVPITTALAALLAARGGPGAEAGAVPPTRATPAPGATPVPGAVPAPADRRDLAGAEIATGAEAGRPAPATASTAAGAALAAPAAGPTPGGAAPEADPWMAFVDRHPDEKR